MVFKTFKFKINSSLDWLNSALQNGANDSRLSKVVAVTNYEIKFDWAFAYEFIHVCLVSVLTGFMLVAMYFEGIRPWTYGFFYDFDDFYVHYNYPRMTFDWKFKLAILARFIVAYLIVNQPMLLLLKMYCLYEGVGNIFCMYYGYNPIVLGAYIIVERKRFLFPFLLFWWYVCAWINMVWSDQLLAFAFSWWMVVRRNHRNVREIVELVEERFN